MKLVLASKNKKKLKEMTDILQHLGVEIVLQSEIGIDIDVEETGTTFAENAFLKAEAVCKASGMPAIADDSGLVVDALDGRPGVYSARYGGDKCADDIQRYQLLLAEMDGKENRSARFVSSICCVFPDGHTVTSEECCEGFITRSPAGENGFGYDPIFGVAGTDVTMAEMTEDEKNLISHRGKAIRAFEEKLRKDGAIC